MAFEIYRPKTLAGPGFSGDSNLIPKEVLSSGGFSPRHTTQARGGRLRGCGEVPEAGSVGWSFGMVLCWL